MNHAIPAIFNDDLKSFRATNFPFDIAIVGEGFFQVNDGMQNLYTRKGNFTLDKNGQIVLASAETPYQIDPNLVIPADAISVTISRNGVVSYLRPGAIQSQVAGHIQLVTFPHKQKLKPQGNQLFKETPASGCAIVGVPGVDGRGQLSQGFLEQIPAGPFQGKRKVKETVK